MIVNRFVGKYKPGMFEEGIAVMSAEVKRLLEKSGYGELRRARLLTPSGQENVIIGEYEFDDMAQKDRFWAAWSADPEVPAFLEKHTAVRDGDLMSETFEILINDEYQK